MKDLGYEPFFPILGRTYLDLQRLRIAVESRMRELNNPNLSAYSLMHELHQLLLTEEKSWLEILKEKAKDHPIWDYCERVKGMNVVAAVTFLTYINPYKAISAGQVWAYFGFVPGQELKSGRKASFNTEAKGRAWLIARNVIMAQDPYYYPLYQMKKQYYMEKMGKYVKEPTLCPDYQKCMQRLKAKAERLRRPLKKPSCKAHIDNRAKRWLIKLILSHALQIMREAEGLDTSNLKSHRNYIPPP